MAKLVLKQSVKAHGPLVFHVKQFLGGISVVILAVATQSYTFYQKVDILYKIGLYNIVWIFFTKWDASLRCTATDCLVNVC